MSEKNEIALQRGFVTLVKRIDSAPISAAIFLRIYTGVNAVSAQFVGAASLPSEGTVQK